MISYGADANNKDKVSSLPIPIYAVSPSHYSNYYAIYYEQSVILYLVIYIMNGDVFVRDMILPSVLPYLQYIIYFTHLLMFIILHVFSRVGKRQLTPQRLMT